MSDLIPRLRDLFVALAEVKAEELDGVPMNDAVRSVAAVAPPSREPRFNGSARSAASRWGVTVDFVPLFVGVHSVHIAQINQPGHIRQMSHSNHSGGPPSDHSAWRAAQAHWEIVVARVLDTDIVAPTSSGDAAIRRAVRASALLLEKLARQGRCPICPDPAPRLRATSAR
jgi:hypothetical protein